MIRAQIATYNIPVVESHNPVTDPIKFMTAIRNIEGSEGVVIAWSDGHRVKAKGDWYILRHRARDSIIRENYVIERIISEQLDDIKPLLEPDMRHRLEKFELYFWHGVKVTADVWQAVNASVRRTYGDDRKAFALADSTKVLDGNMKSAIFSAWGNPDFDWRKTVITVISKNISTQTRVDAARGLWGGAKWAYGGNTGDDE